MCKSSWVKIFISIAKLNDRCFCYFTAASFESLGRTQTWRLHTKLSKSKWHTSVLRIARECNHLSYHRFLNFFYLMVTIFILITWLLKTENILRRIISRHLLGTCSVFLSFIQTILPVRVNERVQKKTGAYVLGRVQYSNFWQH